MCLTSTVCRVQTAADDGLLVSKCHNILGSIYINSHAFDFYDVRFRKSANAHSFQQGWFLPFLFFFFTYTPIPQNWIHTVAFSYIIEFNYIISAILYIF